MALPLFLTSKILCAGGFQITLSGRTWQGMIAQLRTRLQQLPRAIGFSTSAQRSPVLLVEKHAKSNQSMFDIDRDACRRLPSVLISSRELALFSDKHLDFLLFFSPSFPLFLSFSSLLFRVFSSAVFLLPSLSLSLSSLSLSLSLSSPFSSLSYYYLYLAAGLLPHKQYELFGFFFTVFSCLIQRVHATNKKIKKEEETKKKIKKTAGQPQLLRKRITHI